MQKSNQKEGDTHRTVTVPTTSVAYLRWLIHSKRGGSASSNKSFCKEGVRAFLLSLALVGHERFA